MEGIETSALSAVQLKAVQDDLGITAVDTKATNAQTTANSKASIDDTATGTDKTWSAGKIISNLSTEMEKNAVIFKKNFGSMPLAEIMSTYATNNTKMYKGFFDWQDSRSPNSQTCEITVYDFQMTAQCVNGEFYRYRNGAWELQN